MKNTITQAHVDAQIAEIHVQTMFDKVTVVTVRCLNGFVLVESAGAVDKANYSEAIGREICLGRIKNKIWELEGYRLSSELAAQHFTLKNGSIVTGERAVELYEDEARRLRVACDARATVLHALEQLNQRVHSNYDFNADPDEITALVGRALSTA